MCLHVSLDLGVGGGGGLYLLNLFLRASGVKNRMRHRGK